MPASRRSRLFAVAALALTLVAFPLGALASHQFSDVPDSNIYHADIDALADSGVTTGCGGGKFCPSAFVTREQMAAFMNRLGALGPGKVPVVNAAELDGLDSSAFLQADTIVTHHAGPWQRSTAADLVTFHSTSGTTARGNSSGVRGALLHIPTTGAIGTAVYGLSELELCLDDISADVMLANVQIWGVFAFGSVLLMSDDTDSTITGPVCHTYTVPTPAAADYGVVLYVAWIFPGAVTDTRIRDATITWVPVP